MLKLKADVWISNNSDVGYKLQDYKQDNKFCESIKNKFLPKSFGLLERRDLVPFLWTVLFSRDFYLFALITFSIFKVQIKFPLIRTQNKIKFDVNSLKSKGLLANEYKEISQFIKVFGWAVLLWPDYWLSSKEKVNIQWQSQ